MGKISRLILDNVQYMCESSALDLKGIAFLAGFEIFSLVNFTLY